jgi:hypothetical protein
MHGYDVSRVEPKLGQSCFFEISRKLKRAGLDTGERFDAGGRMYRSEARGVVTNDSLISVIGDNHARTLSAELIGRVPPGFVQEQAA